MNHDGKIAKHGSTRLETGTTNNEKQWLPNAVDISFTKVWSRSLDLGQYINAHICVTVQRGRAAAPRMNLCCLTSVRKTTFTRWKSIGARYKLNSLVYSSVQDGAPASSLNVARKHSCNVRQITVTICNVLNYTTYKKDLGQASSCSSHFPFAQTIQEAHLHF